MTWDWDAFVGSADALKWAKRDLDVLKKTVALCPQTRVAVQAGGSLGIYPKFLAERYQYVYTAEPSATNFAALCQNAPERNIIKLQAAFGVRRGPVSIAQVRRTKLRAPAHEGIAHVSGDGPVPVLQIDELRLPVCDLLALDTEGFELHALRGAVMTIAACRPVISVEVNQNIAHYGATKDDVRAFLQRYGYQLNFREHSDEVYVPVERAA